MTESSLQAAFSAVSEFHRIAGHGTLSYPAAPLAPIIPTVARDALVDLASDLANGAARLKDKGAMLAGIGAPATEQVALRRVRFMAEELAEIIDGLVAGDEAAVADGLADLTWVTVGTALEYGIDLPAAWCEVERTNMAKFPPCEECYGQGEIESRVSQFTYPVFQECPACGGVGNIVRRDAAGKILKPADWVPPDIAGALARSRAARAPKALPPEAPSGGKLPSEVQVNLGDGASDVRAKPLEPPSPSSDPADINDARVGDVWQSASEVAMVTRIAVYNGSRVVVLGATAYRESGYGIAYRMWPPQGERVTRGDWRNRCL